MTAEPVDLTTLSDGLLRYMQRWWNRRLYARGGTWLTSVMLEAAPIALEEIETELTRRGLTIENNNNPDEATK